MNDMTPTSTALALPAPSDLATIFKADRGIDPIIAKIEEAARAEAAGLTADTAKGRDALKSLAHKVSLTKAELDRQGKALTEVQRREIEAVNKGRKIAEERLATLRDEIRKPVTDWEEAEAARKARVEAVLNGMRVHGMGAENTSTEIATKAADIKALAFGPDFADQLEQAEMVRETALANLRTLHAAAKTREDQEAELAALRAEKAERERIEAERVAAAQAEAARIAAEEQAKRDADAAEKRRQDELARIEREKAEAAERARAEAERAAKEQAERVQREAAEREAELQHQLAAEKTRAAAAAQAERQRICDDITNALIAMSGASPIQIAAALMAGQIPHCEVRI